MRPGKLGFAVWILAFLAWSTLSSGGEAFRRLRLGEEIPDYSLQLLAGGGTDIRSASALTLINLWATNCTPCRVELPELEQLQIDYANKGLRVMAVSSETHAQPALRRILQASAPSLIAALDPRGGLAGRLGAVGMPESFLIDANGRLLWQRAGRLQVGAADARAAIDAYFRSLPKARPGAN